MCGDQSVPESAFGSVFGTHLESSLRTPLSVWAFVWSQHSEEACVSFLCVDLQLTALWLSQLSGTLLTARSMAVLRDLCIGSAFLCVRTEG